MCSLPKTWNYAVKLTKTMHSTKQFVKDFLMKIMGKRRIQSKKAKRLKIFKIF